MEAKRRVGIANSGINDVTAVGETANSLMEQ
jgi:hypothetical protein